MGQPRLVQHVQGAVQPVHPLVPAVVVGGGHQVKARRLQVIGQLVGAVEEGVAQVLRPPGQGGFQVAQGVVGQGQLPGGVPEDVAEVVPALLRRPGVGHRVGVGHHVPGHHEVGHNGLRFRFGNRFRLGLGGGLGAVRGGRLRRGGAAGQQQGQAQGQGQQSSHASSSSMRAYRSADSWEHRAYRPCSSACRGVPVVRTTTPSPVSGSKVSRENTP